jgi:hypothetical protein
METASNGNRIARHGCASRIGRPRRLGAASVQGAYTWDTPAADAQERRFCTTTRGS